MSRHDLITATYQEITSLNRQIDLKVIRGLSYQKESKRHKFLLLCLYRLHGAV